MFSRDRQHWEQWCSDGDLSGLSWRIISWSRFAVPIVFGFCQILYLAIMNFVCGIFRKGIMMELRLKSSRSFQTMCCRFTVLLLCIVILTWNYHSLNSLARNKQSNQQGLEHCRTFYKGLFFTLLAYADDRGVGRS